MENNQVKYPIEFEGKGYYDIDGKKRTVKIRFKGIMKDDDLSQTKTITFDLVEHDVWGEKSLIDYILLD